ncbi:TPA: hypothetical protein ACUBAH_000418 [Escherichia coli]
MEIEDGGSNISDDAAKQRGVAEGSNDFAQTAGFLSMTIKW